MRFKKIYIEITNSCNFNCSFCFKTTRPTKFMSPGEFEMVVEKIKPFTNYIYLHVLGEPLLHPRLNEILAIAENAALNINITTNGALLNQKKELLLHHAIRQINISLHDAEENIAPEKWKDYFDSVFDFAIKAAEKSYVSLRLWNTSSTESKYFNELCLANVEKKFDLKLLNPTQGEKSNGQKLAEHIFLQLAPRFEWPDENRLGIQTNRTCYALRDHIAILVDGQVVPCCLDANATIKLGNIFLDELPQIIGNERSKSIKKGFEQRKIVESLCATCGFIIN